MKKIFLFLILAAIILSSIYLLIPSRQHSSAQKTIRINHHAAYRYLTQNRRDSWWPIAPSQTEEENPFRVSKIMFNAFEIIVRTGDDSLTSTLQLVPIRNDTTQFSWNSEALSSGNPIQRIRQYRLSNRLNHRFSDILGSMKLFLEKEANVYGFEVREVKVVDSVLISTRRTFDDYPGAASVNEMIALLRNYIRSQNALEKNFPMLNVLQTPDDNYEAMVAIPVDRELPATAQFSPKRVLKGGNLLEAEVRGGPWTIRNGFEQFELYKQDHGRVSPAIPYQSIVTDRLLEKDTTKWITRFYYPVF